MPKPLNTDGKFVFVKDKSGVVHSMDVINARDMVKHMNWELMGEGFPEDVCEACMGSGVFPLGSVAECWHCGGEGVDPCK